MDRGGGALAPVAARQRKVQNWVYRGSGHRFTHRRFRLEPGRLHRKAVGHDQRPDGPPPDL